VDVNCLLEGNNFKLGNYYALDTIKPHPATKEQRDLLFQKMKEAGYEWNEEKKELKMIEQNPTWSEEDEKFLNLSLENLTELKNRFGEEYGKVSDCIHWLQSLKDRVQLEQELDEEVVNECVDLGLPSGTLWKPFNEEGYYTYNEAIDKFGDNLPTKDQWKELRDNCNWEWQNNGYEVTGPNGNTIFLPAKGYCIGTEVHGVGTYGYYWSSTCESYAYCMNFYVGNNYIFVDGDCRKYGNSIRLVGKKKGE